MEKLNFNNEWSDRVQLHLQWFERVTSKIDLKTDAREGYLRAVVEEFTPHIVPA